MEARITYYGKEGTIYSEIEEFEEVETGEWLAPFSNEKDNCTAYGLEECLAQSVACPVQLREEGLIKMRIEKVVDFSTDLDIEKLREKWNTAPCSQQSLEKDEALKRKDQLLAEALEKLIICDWEVSQSVIIKIQKELGITEVTK